VAWRREARQLAARCPAGDLESIATGLLELSDQGNRLARAAVAGSLAAAAEAAGGDRRLLAALGQLRERIELPARGLSLPPAPGAPWEAEAYLIPPTDAALVQDLARTLARHGAASGAVAAVQTWDRLAADYDEGWPVVRGLVVAALRELRAAWPGTFAEASPLDRAMAAWDPDSGRTVLPAAAPDSAPIPALVAWLRAENAPEAWRFADRVIEAEAADGLERSRQLIGCLIALEQILASPGRHEAWLRTAIDRLRAGVRSVKGCQVLDADLIGRSLRQVSELVVVIGTARGAGVSDPVTITRVERPCYALELPSGGRQVLAKALVWIGS
jgi:hypothetical protein